MRDYHCVRQDWRIVEPSHALPAETVVQPTTAASIVDHGQLRFASRMQHARIQARISMHELARRSIIDVEHLARYERGDDEPSDELAHQIMGALRTEG